jgi:pimeloyl-ACP methyl ester carboxylesterase
MPIAPTSATTLVITKGSLARTLSNRSETTVPIASAPAQPIAIRGLLRYGGVTAGPLAARIRPLADTAERGSCSRNPGFEGTWMMNLLAILPFVLSLSSGPQPSLSSGPQPPAGWTDGYVMANGIRIHYWRTGGNKPPLVLAHGSSDDGLCWTNLAREFQDDFDIIMFDARGHGLSDPPTASDPPDVQVEDLAGLIKALKLNKPILMGHSMGSASVAHFAAKYPDVPRAVILEDPALIRRSTPPAPARQTTPEERQASILARNNTSIETLVAGCMKNSPKWGQSECEFWAPSKRRHHPNTALGGTGRRPPMSELFPKIAAPTLILKADAEAEVKKQNEEITSLLKSGRIVHIAGAGHNVRREGKEETVQVLRAFLRGS